MRGRAELQDVLRWQGKLYEVIAINDGQRALVLAPVNPVPCPTCGQFDRVYVIESSRLFQENAEPVSTIPDRSNLSPSERDDGKENSQVPKAVFSRPQRTERT